MLGRKLAGKSQRELRDLGLLVGNGDGASPSSAVGERAPTARSPE